MAKRKRRSDANFERRLLIAGRAAAKRIAALAVGKSEEEIEGILREELAKPLAAKCDDRALEILTDGEE